MSIHLLVFVCEGNDCHLSCVPLLGAVGSCERREVQAGMRGSTPVCGVDFFIIIDANAHTNTQTQHT